MKMRVITFGLLLCFLSEASGRFYFPTQPNTTPWWNNHGDQTRNGGDQTQNGGDQTRNGGDQTRNGGDQTQNGGDQTRNGGNQIQNRTVGDGLPPNACDSNRFSNKIYYNAHPSDCTKYVSCTQLSSGNYLGVVMSCARGRFWNDKVLTCDYPWNVKCAHDKCKTLGNPAVYQTDSTSCLMWGVCSYGITTSIQPCADLKASGTYHSMLGSCLDSRECTPHGITTPPSRPCFPVPKCQLSEILDYENCRCLPKCAYPPNCGVNERLNTTTCRCQNACPFTQPCSDSQTLDLITCQCVSKCPTLYCRNGEKINYDTCRCEPRCRNVQSCGISQKFNDITCQCEEKCSYAVSCRANEKMNYDTCRCEPRCRNVQSCGISQKFNDITCQCEEKCSYAVSCRANEKVNYDTCRCEPRCRNVQSCGIAQKFNDITCQCEDKCSYAVSCRANERVNYDTCRCEPRCQNVRVCDVIKQRFNDITCQCENKCNYLPTCRNDERINYDTCRCESRCAVVSNCNANQRFDYVQCRCINQCIRPPVCTTGEQLDLINCRCVNVFCPDAPICQNGERLDSTRCICTRTATDSPVVRPTGLDCKPTVNINFRSLNQTNSRFLHVKGVTTRYNTEAEDNYTGVFDGYCQILLTKFNFGNTIPPIAISLRYRLEKSQLGMKPYALVTNSNNMQTPSILIAATSSYIEFGIRTLQQGYRSIKVLASGSDWEYVGLIYDGNQLIAQVGDYVQKTPVSGTIEAKSNSLVIGAGYGYENFRGEIDYVRFFQCNPDP
eukprot:XP_014775857.1 PREDICTED: balbiani ring protein 3-like isoform X2 [Octopus bimaculoides]